MLITTMKASRVIFSIGNFLRVNLVETTTPVDGVFGLVSLLPDGDLFVELFLGVGIVPGFFNGTTDLNPETLERISGRP
jgi:hypothetical protein